MMLSVEEKLRTVMIAALEINIQLNQSLLAEEANDERRKFIHELISTLSQRLEQEKAFMLFGKIAKISQQRYEYYLFL